MKVCGFSLVLGLARVGCVTYGACLALNETTFHTGHRFTKNMMVLLDLYYWIIVLLGLMLLFKRFWFLICLTAWPLMIALLVYNILYISNKLRICI